MWRMFQGIGRLSSKDPGKVPDHGFTKCGNGDKMAKNVGKNGALMRVIGLMSGTSCDGVDAALIETDGESHVRLLDFVFRPYTRSEQALLQDALEDARGLEDRDARPGVLADAEAMINEIHCAAVEALVACQDPADAAPALVGFHGQTVWHDPDKGVTVQIGDGQVLADRLGLPVIYDFRAADVAAGGQGAPLVPVYHQALAHTHDLALPCAIINIGGVANITFVDADGVLIAFDCGPGNALIDDFVKAMSDASMDKGGALAAKGTVDYLALIQLMANPYFKRDAPKSLDRNGFDVSVIDGLELEDGVATLTAFTTETIALGLEQMEVRTGTSLQQVIVCGGGQHNRTMMAGLADVLDCPVRRAEDLGWNGDGLEAEAFAYLAVRHKKGLPLTFPDTTGVAEPMRGGVLAKPNA